MTELNRGDIYLVDFNPARGGEMGKLRPAVIISDKDANKVLETVIVVPLSTVLEPDTLPYRYTIKKREKLEKNSDACINEVRSLSKSRVKEKIAALDLKELSIIQNALCEILK